MKLRIFLKWKFKFSQNEPKKTFFIIKSQNFLKILVPMKLWTFLLVKFQNFLNEMRTSLLTGVRHHSKRTSSASMGSKKTFFIVKSQNPVKKMKPRISLIEVKRRKVHIFTNWSQENIFIIKSRVFLIEVKKWNFDFSKNEIKEMKVQLFSNWSQENIFY